MSQIAPYLKFFLEFMDKFSYHFTRVNWQSYFDNNLFINFETKIKLQQGVAKFAKFDLKV